ncbi:MAG TPA: hypothetical protein GX699_06895 [Firmicutes bacterium]|nr:hypothetical protein [Bacillota bacterium]
MEGPGSLLLVVFLAIVIVFALNTLFKIAVRLAVIAVIVVIIIVYFAVRLLPL